MSALLGGDNGQPTGKAVVAPSRGGVRRRLGFTPPGAAAPGNSGHLGCLITVYPFARMRERVNRYICIYSVYVDFISIVW